MRDLRIVFMGTPEFAVDSLSKLVENNYNIVGVITSPDRPAGRGRKLQMSDVKKYALTKGLKILQPSNLKDASFLNELQGLRPNLQVVVAFRMLPKTVWDLPEYGTFNLHASLLPQYRGAAPIHWAIINGEAKTGVTTFFIDEKIDTGQIIDAETTEVGKEETVGELHDRLKELGSELVLKTVRKIESGPVTTRRQPQSTDLKIAPKLTRENTRIDWHQDVTNVFNKIRGLNPLPAAWTILKNGKDEMSAKIFKCHYNEKEHEQSPGSLEMEDSSIKVATKKGFIFIEEIQLPGKRKMTVKDLLNGYSFEENAKML